jgi:hypothetical protein
MSGIELFAATFLYCGGAHGIMFARTLSTTMYVTEL